MKRIFLYFSLLLITFISLSAQAQKPVTMENALHAYYYQQYTEAAGLFAQLVQSDPDDAINIYYQGISLLAMGKKSEASQLFQSGISKSKNAAFCQIGLGAIQMADSNVLEGTQSIVKVIEPTKMKDAPLLLAAAKALIYYKGKNTDQALVYMNKLKDSDKSNPEVFISFGDLYLFIGDGTNALKQYETAQALKPGTARLATAIGRLWAQAMNYSLATDQYKLAITFDSTYGPAYRELAQMYYYAKKYELAKNTFSKFAALCDENDDDMQQFTNYCYLSKDYPATLTQIELIKTMRSDIPSYMYRLEGASDYETGKYAEGLNAMNTFFARHDTSKIIADDYKYYGRLLAKNRQDSLAIISFQKAYAKDTAQTDVLTEMGNAYFQLKKYDEAIGMFLAKTAIKGSTNDYFQLGRAYYFSAKGDTTRLMKAMDAFRKVNELQPTFANGWLFLARSQAAYDKDLKGLAKPTYEKFIELTGGDINKFKKETIEANLYFANFYYFNNQKNESIPFWKKVLELDPKNTDALKAQKLLKF